MTITRVLKFSVRRRVCDPVDAETCYLTGAPGKNGFDGGGAYGWLCPPCRTSWTWDREWPPVGDLTTTTVNRSPGR